VDTAKLAPVFALPLSCPLRAPSLPAEPWNAKRLTFPDGREGRPATDIGRKPTGLPSLARETAKGYYPPGSCCMQLYRVEALMHVSRERRQRPSRGREHLVLQWLPIAVGLGAALLLPRSLVLPAMSLSLLTGAAIAFVLANAEPTGRRQGLPYRDLAGLFAALGYTAALLSDPAEVLPLLAAKAAPP
jgi:hypothetical protein